MNEEVWNISGIILTSKNCS